MAHFAQINKDNKVIAVYVLDNTELLNLPGETNDIKGSLFFQTLLQTDDFFIQTSYNGTFRKHFAGIGYIFRTDLDAFITEKPNFNPPADGNKVETPSDKIKYKEGEWVFNDNLCNWIFVESNLKNK